MRREMSIGWGGRSIAAGFFWLLLLLCAVFEVRAAEGVTVSLPVSVAFVENSPIFDIWQSEIELQAVTQGAPMPEQGERILIDREGVSFLPEIIFTRPGIYHYTVQELLPEKYLNLGYRSPQYHMVVTVMTTDLGLDAVVVVYEKDSSVKLEIPLLGSAYYIAEEDPDHGNGDTKPEPTGTEPPPETDRTDKRVETGVTDSSVFWGFCMLLSVLWMIGLLRYQKRKS